MTIRKLISLKLLNLQNFFFANTFCFFANSGRVFESLWILIAIRTWLVATLRRGDGVTYCLYDKTQTTRHGCWLDLTPPRLQGLLVIWMKVLICDYLGDYLHLLLKAWEFTNIRTYIVSTYNIITRAEIVKTADYNIKTINVLDVRLGYGLISYECSFYGALEALYDSLWWWWWWFWQADVKDYFFFRNYLSGTFWE